MSDIAKLKAEVAAAERELHTLSAQIRKLEEKSKAANRRYVLADQALIRAEAELELSTSKEKE